MTQAHKALRASRAKEESRDLSVRKVSRVRRDKRVQRVHRDSRVRSGHMVNKDLLDNVALQGHRVFRGLTVRRGYRVSLG